MSYEEGHEIIRDNYVYRMINNRWVLVGETWGTVNIITGSVVNGNIIQGRVN